MFILTHYSTQGHITSNTQLSTTLTHIMSCNDITTNIKQQWSRLKASPHWTPNVHWTRLNPLWARSHWMHIHPIQILVPIYLQRWFRSRLIWITQLFVVHEDQKGHGMHTCVDYRQWAHFSVLHTVFHVSAQLKKQYHGWLKYRCDQGAMVAVWRCGHLKSMYTLEFIPHNAVWMHIGFTLNSHEAIQLLNQFESGFSVDNSYHTHILCNIQ